MIICKNISWRLILPGMLIGVILSVSSCRTNNCENKNPVFNKFVAGSKEYQDELAKQVQAVGLSNFTYSFEKYFQKDGKDFIVVSMKGPGLCAKGEMVVQNWGKMQGINAANGAGYRGAQLAGLRYEITHDSLSTRFIYKGVERVID